MGHKVWLTPHWHQDTDAAALRNVDVIVGCQIAEKSTSYIADFARENSIHLVINSSEQFAAGNGLRTLVTYDCDQFNDSQIAFQTVACQHLHEYIQQESQIALKHKYRLIGFPRHDLAVNPYLRSAETDLLRRRYQIPKDSRVFLYLSSFLFEETFSDVPAQDMVRYNYQKLLDRNKIMASSVCENIRGFVNSHAHPRDVLLIKKHPWDPSDRLRQLLDLPNAVFLKPNEYIVPCMDIADFVFHSFSTAAVEAWVMGKPTVSIMPNELLNGIELSHMKHEICVADSKDLACVVNSYPSNGPATKVNEFLGGLSDGMATIRLAKMINELKPLKARTSLRLNKDNMKRVVARNLFDWGWVNPKLVNPNMKMQLLANWEEDRKRIEKIYRPRIDRYLRQYASNMT